MEPASYLTRIRAEAGLLRSAAAQAGLMAALPAWSAGTVRDLVEHLVQVFDLVRAVLRAGTPGSPPPGAGMLDTGMPDLGMPAAAPAAPAGEPLRRFDEQLDALLRTLRETDPAAPVWHFSPTAPRTAAFWFRRLAHEVTIRRIDTQAAAVTPDSGVEPDFAADGVDEALTRLIQRHLDRWAVTDLAGTVLYHAADAGRAWTVRFVPGQLPQTAPETVIEPDASVVGLADALYRSVWHRPSRAVISGDASLLAATRAAGSPARGEGPVG